MKAKRQLHVSSAFQYKSSVPYIRITGKRLREAGFNIGDKYDVNIQQNRLIITNKETDTIDD